MMLLKQIIIPCLVSISSACAYSAHRKTTEEILDRPTASSRERNCVQFLKNCFKFHQIYGAVENFLLFVMIFFIPHADAIHAMDLMSLFLFLAAKIKMPD